MDIFGNKQPKPFSVIPEKEEHITIRYATSESTHNTAYAYVHYKDGKFWYASHHTTSDSDLTAEQHIALAKEFIRVLEEGPSE